MTPHPASRVRSRRLLAPALALVLLVSACGGDDGSAKKTRPATTDKPTTTAETTTTAPNAPPPVAPLTGLEANPQQALRITRPALAVKIDNTPEALPQWGVNNADIVYEIQVEGVSRLMAVFHSDDAAKVGPTRSARFSDPPILAMFGTPLFGWSGANKKVTKAVKSAKYITNVDALDVPKEYKRTRERSAPHNMITSTAGLFSHATPDQKPPPPHFQYLSPGEGNPTAAALAGVNVQVGTTPSNWVWDAGAGVYRRWEYRKPHGTDAGQVVATNVVLLATRYSNPKSPVADTTGAGNALVLTGGTAIAGVWTRQKEADTYTLTAVGGAPIKLTPGRTWVELADHPWGPIAPDVAAGLLAGAK